MSFFDFFCVAVDTENTRVLINLESRTNSIGNKLMLWPSMENWKGNYDLILNIRITGKLLLT